MIKSILPTTLKYTNIPSLTTSLARRALLLISFLLLGLGNVWGVNWSDGSSAKDMGTFRIGTPTSVNYSFNVFDYVSLDNLLANVNEAAGTAYSQDEFWQHIYARWNVICSDGVDANWNSYYDDNGGHTWRSLQSPNRNFGIADNKYVYTFYCGIRDAGYDNYGAWPTTFDTSILDMTCIVSENASASLQNIEGATFILYISTIDKVGAIPGDQWGNNSTFTTENELLLKYTFIAENKPDDFTNEPNPAGCTTGSKSKEIEATTTSIPIDLSEALAKTSGVDYKYVRIYLENNGKVVDPDGKLTVSYQGTPLTLDSEFKERGYWQYEKDGLLQASDFEVTLQLEEGQFENYQVVCVFAKDVDENWNDKEPAWDLQFTYAFEYSFKGQVTDETVKMEETFEVPVSKQSSAFRLSIEYSDNSDNLIKLYYLDQWENTTEVARTSINSQFLSAFPDATVPNDFYIRWFLRKDGEEIYIPASLTNPTNGVYENLAKDRYYCWSTTSGGQGKSLNDILKINFNGGVLSKLTDYELVFTIATDLEGEIYDSGNLTHEPNTMAYEYAFHFIDKPFEARTIENVKSKIAIYDPPTGTVSPDLFTDYTATMADLGTDVSNFTQKGYLRWYVIDTEGNMVDITSENTEWQFTAELEYTNNAYGYYIEPTSWDSSNPTTLNPTFTLPVEIRENYKQYQIVCVMTISGWGNESSLPDYESPTMKMKYVFDLWTEQELNDIETHPFVHYQGEAYRYLMKDLCDEVKAKERDYITVKGVAPKENYTWDISANTYVETTENIRQGVHTYEYDVYVGDDDVELQLPFQGYSGNASNAEPAAYIRWYDYTTDQINDDLLEKVGTKLQPIKDSGWFLLNMGATNYNDAASKSVGVKFKGGVLKEGETATIACDVSKYFDGMVEVDNKYYLLHEPTLSIRYIFNIHHAGECAEKIRTSSKTFENTLSDIERGETIYSDVRRKMFKLFEDNGRVVVSLNGNSGEFGVRTNLADFSYYQLYNTNGTTSMCTGLDWEVYYEDEKGLWKKDETLSLEIVDPMKPNVFKANFDKFAIGYKLLSETNTALKNIKTANGTRFHLIGYLKNADVREAAIHYELNFIDAPAVSVVDLKNAKETDDLIKRTKDYLDDTLTPAASVNFDDKFVKEDGSINYDKPKTWEENILQMPLEWDEAQYGFCYPSLEPYRQKNNYTGFAPLHGDYLLVKSMNLKDVSEDAHDVHKWYYGSSPTLLDYTYIYKHNDVNADDDMNYGAFFYVDASVESRTVANMKFTAALCQGSEIHFTMAVADVTQTGKTPPQVIAHVYKMNEDGTKGQLVISFIACTLNTDIIMGDKKDMATWYQYYGYGTIPSSIELSGEPQYYIVEIDNNSKDTDGADFCVDEIRFYTNTAKVLLTQAGSNDCDDATANDENEVQIYMEGDGLINAFNLGNEPKPIYWRICEEGSKEPITGVGMYPQYDSQNQPDYGTYSDPEDIEGKNTFGVTYVTIYSPEEVDTTIPEDIGWYYDESTQKYFFQIANKGFSVLEKGKNYYVSVYSPNDFFESGLASNWGSADAPCSIFSEFFIPRRQYVTYTIEAENGEEGNDIVIGCDGNVEINVSVNMVLKVPDPSNKFTGFKNFDDLRFDYAFFDKELWGDARRTLDENTQYTYYDLSIAWRYYRGANSPYAGDGYNESGLDNGFNSENSSYNSVVDGLDYRLVLEYAVQKGLLNLANSKTFVPNISGAGTYPVLCLPIVQKVIVGEEEKDICAPFEVIINVVSSGGPSLTLGFEDVDYTNKGIRVVRVGLEQLNNMKNNYLLHIPVHSFKTDADGKEKEGTVLIDGNLEMLQYQEAAEQTNDKDWNENIDVATFTNDKVNKDNMYISVNFNGITNPAMPTFKEGFTYRMFFLVKNEGAEDGACEGKVEFLMKVVPEYVTWNDSKVTLNNNQNTNWNNDANWSRSKKKELYSSSYVDNTGETPATFVPMKFTYVTIPSGNVAPNLINLTMDGNGIYNNIGAGATSNIQYDLMVRYTEETCIDHDVTPNTKIYDCEKFYGNWAKEIYFKPRAELVNQHYLTYEKIWVEKELTAGKWTLMSTPLQNTYAGDMYVPVGGRQETEAFTKISFGNGYSRTLYPIYQKSWKQEGSKVYTMTNDVRATKYEAGLQGGVTSTLTQWSHTYNDVQEPYSQWKGFAIRAHKQTKDNLALLRLPKEDTKYDYYKWDGTVPEENYVTQEVSKSTTGKLFTDGAEDISGLTYGVKYGDKERTAGEGNVEIPIDEVQENNDYLLIGNPYLCSIDMDKFLTANNSILENAYWTYEHNTIESSYTKGTIKPLQSFFVKVKNGVANGDTNITFTPEMMVDGNTSPISPSAASAMTMTASNERGRSTATLAVGEEVRSVETLFDSNLEDVPMVYTVADGQAVSIQQVMDFDKPIAFGVTCAASNELVDVIFTDVAQLTDGDVYVVDAVTGEQTVVGEGSTLSLQPNDYGRYYLLAGTTDIADKVDMQKGIMVSVRGREVTVTSGEELTLVHALSLTGATIYQDAARSTTASFSLPSGVYVIQAENAVGEQQTVKVIVK